MKHCQLTIRRENGRPSLNQLWTHRWQTLRGHEHQQLLWADRHRFVIIPAGRRSGKTELAKRRLILKLFQITIHGRPGRFFAAAPTRDQAKRIFWQDLCDLLKPSWKTVVNTSELRLQTFNGSQLYVCGLDKPQRIEGISWDGGVIDEYADCKPGTFDAHIRPALADRKGWLWLIGVPDVEGPAQVEYERFHKLALSGKDPDWATYHWPSADILPPEEIASAKRHMDPRLFEQEMMGKFILVGGRAFPDYNESLHVKEVQYDPDLPICWSLDFNINPMCSGIMQVKDGEIRVLEEMVLPDTQTNVAVTTFLDRAAENGWNLEKMQVYGDATGNARDSTSGKSDWVIIRNRLAHQKAKFNVPRANPMIKETLNAINAKLKAADETVSLLIHPKCRQLIRDFETALWPSPTMLHDEHALAWLRYFVHREFPIRIDRKKTAGTIGFAG